MQRQTYTVAASYFWRCRCKTWHHHTIANTFAALWT